MTDSAVADHAASDRPTRRALMGAGVIGAALAMAGSRSVSASSAGLSDSDTALVGFAISLELTARDLYDASIAAGADAQVWSVIREHHESYAQRLAGLAGTPANNRSDDVYDALEAGFANSNPTDAAFELENVAIATHVDLLGRFEDVGVAGAIASIISIESRHATVLADLSGRSGDLDAMFVNNATALSPEA